MSNTLITPLGAASAGVPPRARQLSASRPAAPLSGEEPAIAVAGLRCSYGGVEAVRGIDLEIARGEIFALLGPNGAGKTSTVEILAGLRRRSGGEVMVLGEDPARGGRRWRGRIGVVLQECRPEPELTVRECVALYAGYHPHPRGVDETIALVGLGGLAARRCERLSGGEQRRLDVALALVGDPELLFLDEPTTGFDPAARRAAWELVRGLRELGMTIVLSTHYMEEAERMADRIAVIAAGEIVAAGTPQTLGARELMDAAISFTLPEPLSRGDLPSSLEASSQAGSRAIRVSAADPVAALHTITSWAIQRSIALPDLEVRRPSLEDVYLKLTEPPEEASR